MAETAEQVRLQEDKTRQKNWKRWGPYLSERQWGTVREDYSKDGNCWEYLSHDQSRSRAYRWGEDGLMGITDRQGRLCFSLALWNGKDAILKERLFGLTGPQGNHGEDVKECYYYLDSTPTHSYMKALYKYPQSEFPYSALEYENSIRGLSESEYELEDTGVFEQNYYWDVFVEYAKNSPNDILCKITVCNRGPEEATIHVLPTLWFRNTWIWGCTHEGCTMKPSIKEVGERKVLCKHESLGTVYWEADKCPDGSSPQLLYTENETNTQRLFSVNTYTPYVKDAFHRYIIHGEWEAVGPSCKGTKVAGHYIVKVAAKQEVSIRCRLFSSDEAPSSAFDHFDDIIQMRKWEADLFYNTVLPVELSEEEKKISRQAYAGLLWTKQFYHYIIKDWLMGDKDMPPPPEERKRGRNKDWLHLFNRDILSMPDKWEYPWYAAWDLAFHMIPFANIDLEFAKEQLMLMLREWYMHPNGQIPAFEFEYGDVNPPVHAWAALRIFKASGPPGQRDYQFLARCFQKLILNFTWWVNRKDPYGRNIFSGGFLGLDNIGVFDRSKPLPTGGELEQADGTAWMAFYCLTMLDIAIELALMDPIYEDMASKFFEHFIAITDAMNAFGHGVGLWDCKDGFFYDHLRIGKESIPLKIRSLVGLVPLFSCLVLETSRVQKLSGFHKRTKWFIENRQDLISRMSFMKVGNNHRMLLAIPTKNQLITVLKYMLDEEEFLSPYGIRSLSKIHLKKPFKFVSDSTEYNVEYVPGESNTYLFGGNSNWRGPIWLCMNYLLIQALQRYDYFYGESLKVECPTRSGNWMNLNGVATFLSKRLGKLFLPDKNGLRPCHGDSKQYANDPYFKDLVLFYEYFHGDDGRGCGASHQTGWTALIINFYNITANVHHGGMIEHKNEHLQVEESQTVVTHPKSKIPQMISVELTTPKREPLLQKGNILIKNKFNHSKTTEGSDVPNNAAHDLLFSGGSLHASKVEASKSDFLDYQKENKEPEAVNKVDVKKAALLFENVNHKSISKSSDLSITDVLPGDIEEVSPSLKKVDVKKVTAFFELGGAQQKAGDKPLIKQRENEIVENEFMSVIPEEQIVLMQAITNEQNKQNEFDNAILCQNTIESHFAEKILEPYEIKTEKISDAEDDVFYRIEPQPNLQSRSNIPVPAKRSSLSPKTEMAQTEKFSFPSNDKISAGSTIATRVILGDSSCFVVDKINSPKKAEAINGEGEFVFNNEKYDRGNGSFTEKYPSRVNGTIMSPNQAKVPVIRKESTKINNPISPSSEQAESGQSKRPMAAPRSSRSSSDSEMPKSVLSPKHVSFADELTMEIPPPSAQIVKVTQGVIYPPGKFSDDKPEKVTSESPPISTSPNQIMDQKPIPSKKRKELPSEESVFTEISKSKLEAKKKPPPGGIYVLPATDMTVVSKDRTVVSDFLRNGDTSPKQYIMEESKEIAEILLKREAEEAENKMVQESTLKSVKSPGLSKKEAMRESFFKIPSPPLGSQETKLTGSDHTKSNVPVSPVIPTQKLDLPSKISTEIKMSLNSPIIPTQELDALSKIKLESKELDPISKIKAEIKLVPPPPVISSEELDKISKIKAGTKVSSSLPVKELITISKNKTETKLISTPHAGPAKQLDTKVKDKTKVVLSPSNTQANVNPDTLISSPTQLKDLLKEKSKIEVCKESMNDLKLTNTKVPIVKNSSANQLPPFIEKVPPLPKAEATTSEKTKLIKSPSKTKQQKKAEVETKSERKPVIVKEERIVDPVTGKEKVIITMQEEISDTTSNLDGDSFKKHTTTSEQVYVRQEGSKEIKTTVTKERKETVAVVCNENTLTFRYDNGVWKTEEGEIVDSLPVPIEMITRTIETTRASSTKPTEHSTVTTSKTTVLPPSPPPTPKTPPQTPSSPKSMEIPQSAQSHLSQDKNSNHISTPKTSSDPIHSSETSIHHSHGPDSSPPLQPPSRRSPVSRTDSHEFFEVAMDKKINSNTSQQQSPRDNHKDSFSTVGKIMPDVKNIASSVATQLMKDGHENDVTWKPESMESLQVETKNVRNNQETELSQIPLLSSNFPSGNLVERAPQVHDQPAIFNNKKQNSLTTVTTAPSTPTATKIKHNQDKKIQEPITQSIVTVVQVTTEPSSVPNLPSSQNSTPSTEMSSKLTISHKQSSSSLDTPSTPKTINESVPRPPSAQQSPRTVYVQKKTGPLVPLQSFNT